MNQPGLPDLRSGAGLAMDTTTVTADDQHNAFTDLIAWREAFWLVYTASPSHFASRQSRVVLLWSSDAIEWQEVARFNGGGQDIRDPRLAVIGDRLMLYALLNRKFDPQPYATICAQSDDGRNWSAFSQAVPDGWLLGKPETPDGWYWYALAHHLGQRTAQLFRSTDGIQWEPHGKMFGPRGVDETALVFRPDGTLWAAARLESGSGILGSDENGTLIATARPPYESWTSCTCSRLTRLDGPCLFDHGRVYAVGRYQPQTGGFIHRQGSVLSRKRTAIFGIDQQELVHLADLPSSGDTAYAGVVVRDGQLYVSYYTSNPNHDPPWIVGMFRPTRIQISRISLAALAETADSRLNS